MEYFAFSRALLLLSLILGPGVLAADAKLTTEIGTLPICAQACIASSFSTCACPMLDFDCACACESFSPSAIFCVQGACSQSFLQTATDMMSLACPPVVSLTTTSFGSQSQTTLSSTSTSSQISTTASSTISGGNFKSASVNPEPSPTITSLPGPYDRGNFTYPGGASPCAYQTASGISAQSTCWAQVVNSSASSGGSTGLLFLWGAGISLFLESIL